MDQPPQSWLGRNTITTKLVVIVLVFVLVFATVMGLFTCAYNVNAGIRAYVGGEGQWSKGQKDAVYHLSRYVISGDAGDYRDYQTAAALPLGDRKARVEMEKAQYDAAIVRQGFVEGGNAAEDVPQMIFLFRYLGSMPFFGQAIVIWRAAEQEFLQLLPLADEIRDARAQGPLSVSQQAEFLERIQIVNQRVTPLEQQFSQLLGAGAREVLTAFEECGLPLPAAGEAKGDVVDYDGSLYWLERDQNGRIWVNTRDNRIISKPRSVLSGRGNSDV